MRSTLSDLCKSCGKCCQMLVLPVVKPLQKAIMDDWLKARGCEIVSEDAEAVYVKVDAPCPSLKKSEDGWECEIYYKRPEGCRIFDGSKYDFLKCAWKDKEPTMDHVILEKSTTCPHCGKKNAVQMGSRFKEGNVWVRRFRCPAGHIFEDVQ